MKKVTAIPAFIACTLVVPLQSCDRDSEAPASESLLRPVRTVQIGPAGAQAWRELPGVVDAVQKADLSFRIAGKLETLEANEGDIAGSNQVLARLEATDYRIQLDGHQAEYNQARADYERGLTLVDKGVISRSDFDRLEAQHASAKANLDSARQNLEYTFLRAPFPGLVSRRHVDNFEDVNAGQAIYSLQDISSLTVKVNVPESLMIHVRRGARPELYALFDAIPDRQFPLVLKEVSLRADESTKTFEVTLSMPGVDDYIVLPGMSVTVRGERDPGAPSDTPAIYVPGHAVLEDESGRYVFVARPTSDGRGVVERRAVETGDLTGLGLEVSSGLGDGDRVVTAGMSKMHSGLEVKMLAEKAE